MKRSYTLSMIAAVTFLLGACLLPCSAQIAGPTVNGKPIIVPKSSIPRVGHINTNYFLVGSNQRLPQPPPDAETPGSVACVYELVSGPTGCPIATSTNVPTGGVGAIAIVDAGDYPTAKEDLHAFSSYFGIPDADFQVVYANGHKPPVYDDWEVEESLDIEWV